MKIVFRVDASIAMGTGHVMRCRTLAAELKKRGAHIRFITRAHPGHLADMLTREGFAVALLPQPAKTGNKENGYASWLGVSQQEDADQTIAALENQPCDWLIVDHYGLDRIWEEQLQPYARKLMVIDDLANRPHECDVLLDQNYAVAGQERYRPWVSARCQLLLGTRYALLRSEYARYRETAPKRTGDIKRVLVFMGGADNANITGKVLDALSTARLEHLGVDVVIGPNFIHESDLVERACMRADTRIHGPRAHLADLMAAADLAIGAGGATTWERLCMGLPSLVVSIAENQVPACEALAASGLIRYLGGGDELDAAALESTLIEALAATGQLRDMAASNQVLVDGRGASRVAEVLIPTSADHLRLRPAHANDALTYFDWVNDPMVRASAINSGPIDMPTHLKWFEGRLKDADTYLYVLEAGDLPVGQVRFERHGAEAIIDYSLDILVRGRGWAGRLLRLGMDAFRSSRPTTLSAMVKPLHIVSTATFIRLAKETTDSSAGESSFSISVISDQTSWINDWIPKILGRWLSAGHRVLWTHQADALQSADFCFYLSFSNIVPKNIRAMFKNNLVVHESELPHGKGWSPLTWQILEGKNKIPVSLIEAEDKVDSGVIYAQEWITFEGHELIGELREGQAKATTRLCERFIENYPIILTLAREQVGQESFYRRRRPEDSVINPEESVSSLFNNFRVADGDRYPVYFVKFNQVFELHLAKRTR